MNLKPTFALALSLATLSAAQAGIPEGSFRGESPKTRMSLRKKNNGADAMAFFVRKDPKVADRYYGVLAHYDRIVGTNFSDLSAVVKWVPRMWLYQIDKRSDLNYKLSVLSVGANGALEVKAGAHADDLVLKKDGKIKGAELTLRGKNGEADEIVEFAGGTVISTWEPYRAGKYFRSVDSSGGDYFKKESVNTNVKPDGTVTFDFEGLRGKFTMTEVAPGIFTFGKPDGVKENKYDIQSKIGVFIDIMNWKVIAGKKTPFQTNELMIVDPANEKNVGFFYERVFGKDKND